MRPDKWRSPCILPLAPFADQMLSEDDLGALDLDLELGDGLGFVDFGADVDDVAATQVGSMRTLMHSMHSMCTACTAWCCPHVCWLWTYGLGCAEPGSGVCGVQFYGGAWQLECAPCRLCKYRAHTREQCNSTPLVHAHPHTPLLNLCSASCMVHAVPAKCWLCNRLGRCACSSLLPGPCPVLQRELRQLQRAAAAATAAPEEEEAEPAAGRRSRRAKREAGGGMGRRSEIPDDLLPKVAIVGRPNVGKSGAEARGGLPAGID